LAADLGRAAIELHREGHEQPGLRQRRLLTHDGAMIGAER
jgi:hypothetical protein